MLIQFHYKHELDLKKTVKYAVDFSLSLKTSLIISGYILLATLYNSIVSVCILLQCIETELSLFRSSSKLECLENVVENP